jgi:hypothetical protein
LPIKYEINRSPDGTFKMIRFGRLGKPSRAMSLTRSELENFLNGSVLQSRLSVVMRTLDMTGTVTIEADLETV